jgi:hypothetical protein
MIQGIGSGVVAMVGQFPWGPPQQLITPAGTKELIDMFAPRGMDHLCPGYLALLSKGFPSLRLVRALAQDSVAATCSITWGIDPLPKLVITAKYPGSAGNSLVATVSAASNGNPMCFNLTVSVSGASGNTSDVFRNLSTNTFGTTNMASMLDGCLLVGNIYLRSSLTPPEEGVTSFSGGSEDPLSAADYVGTPSTGDRGLAILEADKSIRMVFVDDCGSTLRPVVNAGVRAHVELMGDRLGFIHGDPGMQISDVLTDVQSYRSDRVVYMDPWCFTYDDVTGAERLVPPSSFGASVAAQVSPSTSIAWKDSEVGAMLSGIVRLETDRGAGIPDLTDAGIVAVQREEDGGYRLEAGVLTIAPSDPSKRNITRTRMGDYIAVSFARSVRSMVDAPNVPMNRMMLVGVLQAFMEGLVANRDTDPAHLPYVDAYELGDLSSVNSQSDLAEGNFTIPLSVRIGSSMERIFLSIMHGESVVVRSEP